MNTVQILVKCQSCATDNLILISQTVDGNPVCNKCQTILLNYTTIKGYVYILSNPNMSGLLKIGFTTRPIEKRVAELSSHTGVPAPFELEALFTSTNPQNHEKQIQERLMSDRKPGKEFYFTALDDALKIAQLICGGRPPTFQRSRKTAPIISNLKTQAQLAIDTVDDRCSSEPDSDLVKMNSEFRRNRPSKIT